MGNFPLMPNAYSGGSSRVIRKRLLSLVAGRAERICDACSIYSLSLSRALPSFICAIGQISVEKKNNRHIAHVMMAKSLCIRMK